MLIFLAAFFFFKWFRETHSEQSIEEQRQHKQAKHPYAEGISVGLMNFLAIPYFFAIGSWLMADGVLSPEVIAKALFVVGRGRGCQCFLLVAYATGARWIDKHGTYADEGTYTY